MTIAAPANTAAPLCRPPHSFVVLKRAREDAARTRSTYRFAFWREHARDARHVAFGPSQSNRVRIACRHFARARQSNQISHRHSPLNYSRCSTRLKVNSRGDGSPNTISLTLALREL